MAAKTARWASTSALQPFVNIDRDLEFGRGYNTFGEDPFLTAEMGVAEIKGIQSQHVMAQIKHYVAYDSDGSSTTSTTRRCTRSTWRRSMRPSRPDVSSIMCSYNRVNGTFACGNESTLTKILRDEIGFKGFVTSDWGAVHAVKFINAGLDMEMPGEPAGGGGFPLPSFFDLLPAASPAAAARSRDATSMMEPCSAATFPRSRLPQRGHMGDFGRKAGP